MSPEDLQCSRKTFMVHQTFVWWALYILFKFVKSLIRHLAHAIGNVRHVRWFSWTLDLCYVRWDADIIDSCSFDPALWWLQHWLLGADQDGIIKWKHFLRQWPFVRGNHWLPVNSPHKGQWHGALTFTLIHAWTNGWVNNRDASDLRCHHTHYDVTVMILDKELVTQNQTGNSPLWISEMQSSLAM